ncbi:heavy metal efflux pump, cobalt-zinc-cadmium [Azospira oryzae PS]|uniref:Heavy metal efflux pump, cobalt-zinc-cadmium n=1 Tax=Azospira oryzae (strain ATCC BAA-33 / DSM 13638 / PS) TaxID=640081 RepID=G8QKM0_AZOOP|nr:CusA/CzcA family heavy metal efflux RND transporter [Azospira oryzae]AEV27759.1 heavy metal efflux pump, cobalt-zinc-cadmium [Azospira oryzae PS]
MLSRLVEFSLAQRLLMLVLTALLVGAGIMAFHNLPIDAFPDVSTTQVKIIMKAPGMTPEEVEARIVVPIEQEMLGIPKQRILRTTSKYAIADVTIDFEDGTDIYWARQQVAERLGGVELPPGASGGLAPITTPLSEMFMFTVEGPLSLEEKRTILDWTIRPQLRTLRGVADVNSLGGHAKAFEVVPDAAALNARGVSLNELRQAVEGNNRNDGAGRLTEGEETLLVRVEGAVRSLEDLRAIVIAQRGGNPVRVGDVAEVRFGALTRYGAVTKDGQGEAVEGLVLGLRGANAQQVVDQVKAKLAEIQATLPEGVSIVPFYDRGHLVERAVGTVSKALGEAIVLVVILLLAFLGNLRAALVVSVILPLSALLTFILMQYFGLSANLMSLGGLAIAIGMLVDAAVVIVENVESHLSSPHTSARLPLLHVIYRSVREVTVPVASGIAIIVIVFVPLLTLEGLEGKLFIPVALTIVFALVSSLLLALTVIPALASMLMQRGGHHEAWLVQKLNAAYAPALDWALAHTRQVVVAALALLVLAIGAYTLLGKTFLPTMDEGDLIIQLEKLPSISLEETVETDQRVQRAILERVPEVKNIIARVGSDELGLDPMGLNQTDTFLVLKPIDEWRQPDKDWLTDQLRQVMEDFPGIAYTFTQPIDMRISEMLTGVRGDIAVKVFGTDLDQLNHAADGIVALLKGIKGAEDVFTLKNEGVQYLKVEIDRLAAGRLGLPIEDVQNALKTLVEGLPAGLVVEPGRRTPVLLRGGPDYKTSVERFADLRLSLPGEGTNVRTVPLSQVAKIERVEGPVKVDRENAQRYVVIQSNVRDRDLVGFVEEAQAKVAQQLKLPQGYRIVWGGQFENQQRAAQRLMLVVPVALGLIFMLLFSTFGSLRQAGLVLAMIPFALVGGVFALLLSGQYLSVPASVGFIALLGIAVLNGVVMLTYFNQLRTQGLPLEQVVREGARRRLRPVLMTASIAAFGLVPLLFASGPGSEIQKPLAIVVIGGLLSSTLLTLLLLPILYRRFGFDNTPGERP